MGGRSGKPSLGDKVVFTKAHKHQDSGQADRSGLPFYPPPTLLPRRRQSWVGGKGGEDGGETGRERTNAERAKTEMHTLWGARQVNGAWKGYGAAYHRSGCYGSRPQRQPMVDITSAQDSRCVHPVSSTPQANALRIKAPLVAAHNSRFGFLSAILGQGVDSQGKQRVFNN